MEWESYDIKGHGKCFLQLPNKTLLKIYSYSLVRMVKMALLLETVNSREENPTLAEFVFSCEEKERK